jgi:hypothetical protein
MEVEVVIWFGITAIVVIAVVIGAIGRPDDGDGPAGARSAPTPPAGEGSEPVARSCSGRL